MDYLSADITVNSIEFRRVKDHYTKMVAQKEEKENQLKVAVDIKEKMKKRHEAGLKARKLVQKVAKETQQKLEGHIGNLVTIAEAAVFPEPYEFEVEFVERRNQTECDMYFVKDGNRMNPILSSGGGALDVASFALRCAFWSLKKTRPTLLLDEPFRNVSADLQLMCVDMLKYIRDNLGIQIIIVSHLRNLIGAADKVFRVEKVDGVSNVEEV